MALPLPLQSVGAFITVPIYSDIINAINGLWSGTEAHQKLAGAVLPTTATGSQHNFALGSAAVIIRCNNATALTFTGFATGSGGDLLIIENVGTSTVKVAHQDTNSTAANRVICESTSGQIVGAGGRMMLWYDATTSRWRLSVLTPGAPISVAYSALNFVPTSGTWTVEAADQQVFTYTQNGKRVRFDIRILTSTITVATPQQLQVVVPFTSAQTVEHPVSVMDNGAYGAGFAIYSVGFTWISFRTPSLANWQLSSNSTQMMFHNDVVVT